MNPASTTSSTRRSTSHSRELARRASPGRPRGRRWRSRRRRGRRAARAGASGREETTATTRAGASAPQPVEQRLQVRALAGDEHGDAQRIGGRRRPDHA